MDKFFVILILLYSQFALATGPQFFTLDGALTLADGTTPIEDSNIQLTLQILNANENCILYEETQTINTSETKGVFSVPVGSAFGGSKRSSRDSGLAMNQVYSNTSPLIGKSLSTESNCSYTPTTDDHRFLRVLVLPAKEGILHILAPNMPLSSYPTAIVADRAGNADSLQGYTQTDFAKLNTVPPLTQTNIETVFSSENYPKLASLLSTPVGGYVLNAGNGAIGLSQFNGNPGSGLAAGQMWYDSGNKKVKFYDGLTIQSIGVSTGTTVSYPGSTTVNQLLYSSTNNSVDGLPTANNSVLTTNSSGVPSWGAISNDVFAQYVMLSGRNTGQSLSGGTAALASLTLDSTTHATQKGNILINPNGGNVGINRTPRLNTRLDVSGQIVAGSSSNSSGVIDFSLGNSITSTFDCGSQISFVNLKDGGNYILAVTGTGTTMCDFNTSITEDGSTTTVIYRFAPANATRTASTHTLYTLSRIGTIVYVSWISDF
jgi:hypothetical protein